MEIASGAHSPGARLPHESKARVEGGSERGGLPFVMCSVRLYIEVRFYFHSLDGFQMNGYIAHLPAVEGLITTKYYGSHVLVLVWKIGCLCFLHWK